MQYTQKQIKLITENFQHGQKAIQAGRFDRAEKHYLEILKIDSNILDAQNALAFVYTFSKQHTKAITQLKTILKSTPNDANAHHNLANNLYAQAHLEEAIEHYKIAININPSLVDSYIQCGMVYRNLMQYDEALQHLSQAHSLDSSNPKALHGLGLTYAELEDYPRALQHITRAVKLAPNNMEFNLALAQILQAADLGHEADIQYHHTCNTFPNYADAFVSYGKLLYGNRYYDEALECLQHAEKLSSEKTEIFEDIANVYLGLADVDKAIQHFRLALSKEPNRLSALMGMGQAYLESGKEAEATQLCNETIALDPDKPYGYALKSRVKKSKIDDGLTDELIRLSNLSSLTDEERIPLNFALGKIYDDHKNFAAAFKHYASANVLKCQATEYDEAAIDAEFNAIIDYFNEDFFARISPVDNASALPIFIVGMPRSGTTLTEQIISSHPSVIGAGEVTFWLPLASGMHKMLNTAETYPKCIGALTATHFKDIISRYELMLRKITGLSSQAKHITDKMPHNFLAIGLIAQLYPKARIIHTRRDAMDTCLSIFFQNFHDFHGYGTDLARLGRYYKRYERMMAHWHKVLPGRIMDIHYTDTITDPEYWSRKLIAHVGLDWDDACLAPHKLERSVKTASHWQVKQPIYKTSLERWRHYEPFLGPLKSALAQ